VGQFELPERVTAAAGEPRVQKHFLETAKEIISDVGCSTV
jgi:hypothetical protein